MPLKVCEIYDFVNMFWNDFTRKSVVMFVTWYIWSFGFCSVAKNYDSQMFLRSTVYVLFRALVDALGMLIRLVQTKIGIGRLVYNAIKLSSSRGIHQCSKQDIKRLLPTNDYCIFRVNTIRHEESTDARNKTTQEHYGWKMTMFLGQTIKLYDPKNLTSNLQELEGIIICFSHRNNWCSQQWHERILHN